jgi:hypothetical protein
LGGPYPRSPGLRLIEPDDSETDARHCRHWWYRRHRYGASLVYQPTIAATGAGAETVTSLKRSVIDIMYFLPASRAVLMTIWNSRLAAAATASRMHQIRDRGL